MTKQQIENLRELVGKLDDKIIPELLKTHQDDRDEKVGSAYKAEELFYDSGENDAVLYNQYCQADDAARQADWVVKYLEDLQDAIKKAAEAIDNIEETVVNPQNLSRWY